jgi:hypothetical protein
MTRRTASDRRTGKQRLHELEEDFAKVCDHEDPFTESELRLKQDLIYFELQEEKAEAQKKMAWFALIGMFLVTAILFSPIFPDSRIVVITEILGWFYISVAGVVGAYMGVTAWITKSKG